MNSRPPLRFRHSAFTLVELLTVIAIIAILMGLLFPAIGIVKDQANKVNAKSSLMSTVAAVKQYYTEYGKYPLTGAIAAGASTGVDITFGDSNSTAGSPGNVFSNEQLYNILRNYPYGNRPAIDGNPRQIVFFEGRNGVATGANPRNGFSGSNTTGTGTLGAYYDPWGAQYAISIDGTYDNYVPVPYLDFPAPAGSTNNLPTDCVNTGCAAWSVGKDGKVGTTGDSYFKNPNGKSSDDVISWQ